MNQKYSPLALLIALTLLGNTSAPAQQDDDSAPIFGEIVDVRVINLEVVVTDGRERVGGLTSEDFRLLVDGEEVPIEYFTEVSGGFASSATPTEAAAVPALAPGEAVGTRYLVFIDDSFTIPAHRNRVLRRLSEQLPLLGAADHMAVVAFDGSRIDLLTSWTRSIPELERVFEAARERKGYGLYNRNRHFGFEQSFYNRAFGGVFDDPRFGLSSYVTAPRGSRTAFQVERVIDAAASTLRGFAKPPGRKVMLMLSGGWPAVGSGSFSSALPSGFDSDRYLFAPLIDTANRLGYSLYPVDLQGLESHIGGAQFGSLRESNFAAELSREREWIEEGALLQLARETGGKAHLDGAGLKALERTIEDTRSYYWLGFSPAWRENDERHRVKVEVLRKGLKVRSRKSFSDLSRQTEVTMLVESSQLFDLPMPGETAELGVSFGEPQPGGRRKVVVPMLVEIPLDAVTVLPTEKGYVAQLELRVAVTDDRGERADIPVVPVELVGENEPEAGQRGSYELGLKLRRRPHKVLVSVHDAASGAILSKRVELSL